MAYSITGHVNVHVFLYLRVVNLPFFKYLTYTYILVREIMCENIIKITQIFVEIWAYLLLSISFKIATLRYKNDFYFCRVTDITPDYHLTKFGSHCLIQCRNMKTNLKIMYSHIIMCCACLLNLIVKLSLLLHWVLI